MRFASKYGRMTVQIQPQITETYATGGTTIIQNGVYAVFRPAREGYSLQPFERELVLAHWKFNGLYQELDEVTMVDPDYRIGVFDSLLDQQEHRRDDEMRVRIEQELIRTGTDYDYVMALPATTVPPPWPLYDDFQGTVRQLLKKLEEDGHNLEQVLVYERAMQNRPALVDALSQKLSGFDLEEAPKEEEILA